MAVIHSRRSFLKAAGLATIASSLGSLSFPLTSPAAEGNRVTSEQIRSAVRKSVAWIKQRQNRDGSWSGGGRKGGATALALLALLNAGVDKEDPVILKGLQSLEKVPDDYTYAVSLKCQVYAAIDPKKYAPQLKKAAQYLIAAQKPTGMWSYQKDNRGGDNSNTQFALLGLHEAAAAGVQVPPAVWIRSNKHFTNTQCNDGGWEYNGRGKTGYGSMTAAAIASLYICGEDLNVGGKKAFINGVYPDCGKYSQHTAIAGGLAWMTDNFSVTTNPRRGSWLYYYLYAMERVGMITGARTFGKHDWYRMGAEQLVKTQKNDGSWGRDVTNTAFALLFLAKGNRPVLLQKVQRKGKWNRNIHDLKHLCSFIGNKLGKPTTWQSTSLDLELEELRTSPILFITGHEFPNFTEKETQKLRSFVQEAGGTLFFEACCGSAKFTEGFRVFARKLLPDHHLMPLQPDHAVFHSLYEIKDTYGLEGIGSGCRTDVFFSPRALSCLWELEDIPLHSEKAFKLGANIAALATAGDQLRDRLDIIQLPEREENKAEKAEIPRGAVRIARLVHGGDYNADPLAMVKLAERLRKKAGIDVFARSKHIRATDKLIYEYPVVFMNGHHGFKFRPEEIKALGTYLKRGGFLLASNCCGEKKFDESFRRMVNSLFPDVQGAKLKALDPKHPVYSGKIGFELGELKFRPILAKELGRRGTANPPLEGLAIDGRFVILYSKYDWCCALQGDRPYSCRGYMDEDGGKLATALLLYAMSF